MGVTVFSNVLVLPFVRNDGLEWIRTNRRFTQYESNGDRTDKQCFNRLVLKYYLKPIVAWQASMVKSGKQVAVGQEKPVV